MSETQERKPKRIQKPKKGRVIRITPDLVDLIAREQIPGETIYATLRRLLGLEGEVSWVLPSDLHQKIEDARGSAVLRALGKKTKKAERPIPVRPLREGRR